MKKTVSIVIVIFLIVGIVSILYMKNTYDTERAADKKMQHAVSSDNPLVAPTGAGTIKNPSTWSTYVFNNEWQVKFPPKWHAKTRLSKDGVDFISPGFYQDDEKDATPYDYGKLEEKITYTIFGQTDILNMKNIHEGTQFLSDDKSATLVVTHVKHFRIDSHDAIGFDYYPTSNIYYVRTRIGIRKENKLYTFNATYTIGEGEEAKELFEKMMNTFRFIPS